MDPYLSFFGLFEMLGIVGSKSIEALSSNCVEQPATKDVNMSPATRFF
jgi:hypothetical protein